MILDIVAGSMQTAVIPDELRARVAGAERTINYGIRPIGALLGGALGAAIGVRADALDRHHRRAGRRAVAAAVAHSPHAQALTYACICRGPLQTLAVQQGCPYRPRGAAATGPYRSAPGRGVCPCAEAGSARTLAGIRHVRMGVTNMKIATIMALARPGRSRVRPGAGDARGAGQRGTAGDHCGCVRLCVGQRGADERLLQATCVVRGLLDGSNESRRPARHASSNSRGRQ